jgi:hypothetical protein
MVSWIEILTDGKVASFEAYSVVLQTKTRAMMMAVPSLCHVELSRVELRHTARMHNLNRDRA